MRTVKQRDRAQKGCDPCPGFKTWLDKALHNQV